MAADEDEKVAAAVGSEGRNLQQEQPPPAAEQNDDEEQPPATPSKDSAREGDEDDVDDEEGMQDVQLDGSIEDLTATSSRQVASAPQTSTPAKERQPRDTFVQGALPTAGDGVSTTATAGPSTSQDGAPQTVQQVQSPAPSSRQSVGSTHAADPAAAAATPSAGYARAGINHHPYETPRVERSSTSYSTRTSTSTTTAGAGKPILQGVLVISSFETILNSKEAKRIPALKAAAQKALDVLRSPGSGLNGTTDAEDRREEVFEPLKLACETKSNALMMTALDAIGKLVSYGFFNPPLQHNQYNEDPNASSGSSSHGATADGQDAAQPDGGAYGQAAPEDSFVHDARSEQLSETVVNTICSCFLESPSGPAAAALQVAGGVGPDAVNLQIVKALLTLVLSDGSGRGLSVHQSGLVRLLTVDNQLRLLTIKAHQ